jgi:hypothetical protein
MHRLSRPKEMTMNVRLKVVILIMMVSCPAWAGVGDQDAPATQPLAPIAAMPATMPVAMDQTTPKGTLVMLANAVPDGDEQIIKALIVTETPSQARLLEAFIRRQTKISQFRKAIAGQFGDPGMIAVLGDPKEYISAQVTLISQSKEIVNGDAATVAITGSNGLTSLKKVDGKWRLLVSSLLGNTDPQQEAAAIAQAVEEADTVSDAITLTTQELSDGRFKTTEELTQHFQSQIMKLVTDRRAAAATTQAQ